MVLAMYDTKYSSSLVEHIFVLYLISAFLRYYWFLSVLNLPECKGIKHQYVIDMVSERDLAAVFLRHLVAYTFNMDAK